MKTKILLLLILLFTTTSFSTLKEPIPEEQCYATWRWIGDSYCNIRVRVDNPCPTSRYFYIMLNNCNNCIYSYKVPPYTYLEVPIQWCPGATFHWGR